ncbi:MAG: YihY family inner membrane protein [Burkholderiaceae bacterium]|nr:YihY family inner membrane protein [Burkholderiaceae bacterium]
MNLQRMVESFSAFPWRNTVAVLRERFREDHLGLTASSLTFTTSIALVPFITVALALFTAFPMFAQLQATLQNWLVTSLVPDNIARQVLGYLTQFAGKANKLGTVGFGALLVTAIALILTIDRTLNTIWRVRRPRPLAQRVLIYWAAITLGPLLLGASLALTSYVVSASRGIVGSLPGGLRFVLDLLEYVLLAGGLASLYHYVPNTFVKWSHAWIGGVCAAGGIEIAKKLLTIYIGLVPTYSVVYGAFATLPILLIWIYVAWIIVLLGAVVAAYLPSLLGGVARRAGGQGWQFQLAVEVLQHLSRARDTEARGLSASRLAHELQVDALQLEPVLDALTALDWVGRVEATETRDEARYVLLTQPEDTPLQPLMERLLLTHAQTLGGLWSTPAWAGLRLKDVL